MDIASLFAGTVKEDIIQRKVSGGDSAFHQKV